MTEIKAVETVAPSDGVTPICGAEFEAMDQPDPSRPSPLPAVAALLGASALVTGAIAAAHMWLTAQRGPICGVSDGGHCWACYVAPLLAMAALTAWHAHRSSAACAKARSE